MSVLTLNLAGGRGSRLSILGEKRPSPPSPSRTGPLLTALATLWIGYRLLKISMSLLIGPLAGLQTQPAVLGFALEQTGNDLPNLGYARMFALAVIVKIILAQLLVASLP